MLDLRVAVPVLSCFWVIPQVVESQAAAPVRGRIVAADSAPLHGALVELIATGDSARSTATGEFFLARVPVGKQALQIRLLGYKVKVEEILVEAGSGWDGTVTLETSVAILAEVEVTSALDKPDAFANTAKYVEFYRGPSQVPPELDRGDSCAALVVWTR